MAKDETKLPPGIKAAADLDWAKDAEGFEIEENLSLKEGQALEGEYLGPGPLVHMAEQMDKTTGEVTSKTLKTFRVRVRKGLVYNLMGTAGIEARFSSLPVGTMIKIAHAGKEKSGKGQVNIYRFAVKRPADAATISTPVVGKTTNDVTPRA